MFIRVHDVSLTEAAAEVSGSGGVGDTLGAEGVEIDLVVTPQFDVFDPLAPGQDVERDVQDMVGFVIRQMSLEDVDHSVDRADQSGLAGQQEHGADAAGAESLDTIGQLVMDVGGGHHRLVAFRTGSILDAVEDSALAFVEILRLRLVTYFGYVPGFFDRCVFGISGDSSIHSKTSVVWNSEDVFLPPLFQNLWGFRVFSQILTSIRLYITLG